MAFSPTSTDAGSFAGSKGPPSSLLLVLPIVGYYFLRFAPSSPEQFDEAQAILVNFRIPHHARFDRWFDTVAFLQIAWILWSIVLVRRTRLFLILIVPFSCAALLTLIQVITESKFLSLLFPWRISAVLVPVATTIVLTRLAELLPKKVDEPMPRLASMALILGFSGAGIWIMTAQMGFQTGSEEKNLTEFVSAHKAPGDVYFIPVNVPTLLNNPRGSLSSDFKPVVEKRADDRVIPVDLQGFRLATGAPIFIDFKSIPYKDVEILEWHSRLSLAYEIQQELGRNDPEHALNWLASRGVTHVVRPAHAPLNSSRLEKVFEDTHYFLYRLK